MIAIEIESPVSPDAEALFTEFGEDLKRRYTDFSNDGYANFHPSEVQQPRSVFVVARSESRAVGCGALRVLDEQTAEIKRLFVRPEARGHGVATQILEKLESLAREYDYDIIRLETGIRQPEAMALFGSAGFYRIPKYGEYENNPVSACFEKRI
jgi:putative acetyltransferase